MSEGPRLPSPGETLGDFVLTTTLDALDYATVYDAQRASDGLRACVTVLAPAIIAAAPETAERLLSTTRDAIGLDTPHLAALLASGLSDHGLPWLAIGLMGVGGALLVTTVVLEIAIADDVDAYPRERERCLSGTSVACSRALELSDDIRTQQIVTGTLIGVGLVALGGGLAWYLLLSDDDAADASEVMLAPSVGRHSGQLELTVRF